MRFISNSGVKQQEMLKEIGKDNIDQLFEGIPPEARTTEPLDIPRGLSETEHLELFKEIAAKNNINRAKTFLGGGSYDHFSPLIIDAIIQRGEFLTSYTPYQPEISQGTLQAAFEFQSYICMFSGMDVANASVYEGASATAEAVCMGLRISKERRILHSASLNPRYQSVLQTLLSNLGTEISSVGFDKASGRLDLAELEKSLAEGGVNCVVVQQPNFFGVIEDLKPVGELCKAHKALFIVTVTEAISMALLESAGASGADMVVGEGQSFGIPLQFGGPYVGFMACKDEYKRQMPGRIVGEATDAGGEKGFVLTLSTREQHIRRDRATSNICTSQSLFMLVGTIYLAVMGRDGLREVARRNIYNTHYLKQKLDALPGYSVRFTGATFNEFVLDCPAASAEVIEHCAKSGIVPGLDLSKLDQQFQNSLLICATENKTKSDLDGLVNALANITK